ncbi:phage integrase [Microvirga lotononidis]|uniref:phage integrase n=1 Tax=Microvirga lotononidis TaxID=864069 RepID=UPI0012B57543|nr:tyrosine-type recombinase/integrase [Microvirga lotononidis]WQO28619.1 tyrosine-type recombinase/integrase [Microvirga lotononidis]
MYFYYRRIPEDLRSHYGEKRFRRVSLQTNQPHIAAKKIAALAAKDDALWASLRSSEGQELGLTTAQAREGAEALIEKLGLAPGDGFRANQVAYGNVVDVLDDYFGSRYSDYQRARNDENFGSLFPPESFYTPVEKEAVRLIMDDPKKRCALLTDALEIYLKNHDKGEQEKFARDTRRAIQHVVAAVGDFPLNVYRREDANAVREHLVAKGIKTGTVRREINRIKAVFNVGLIEFDLGSVKNPFEKLRIANEEQDAENREPFTAEELRTIGRSCQEQDDDIRHIIALQTDTGARLGEIVGLRVEDVALTHDIPHVHIRPHQKLGRTLKTDASERKVPLVGVALWAAQRALEASRKSGRKCGWLFPRYASDSAIKATYASNTINKWLQTVTKTDKTSHSFRHSMRDRLRHVNAPQDIQDAIGGWGSRTVGMGYGEGYRLEQLRLHIERVVLH